MLDNIPDDILLIIIDNLDYLDKCRLSYSTKYLSNIFKKYKNNICSETILDITDDNIFSDWPDYDSSQHKQQKHLIDFNNKLVSCINKFPKIKLFLSNNYDLSNNYNNIYSYSYNFHNNYVSDNILPDVLTNCPNIKILNIVGYQMPLNCYNLLRLDKLELDNCNSLEDISLLGNINDLSIHDCNNITILPKVFNCKYLSFSYCDFINNDNLNINTYKLSLIRCNNITNLTKLNLSTIKFLIIRTNNNLIIPKLDNLEYFEIVDDSCSHINYLGDNIKSLSINCYSLTELPKIKYLEELKIYDDLNINLDGFDYLKELDIQNNSRITTLDYIKNINSLRIWDCYNLVNINSLTNIEHMDLIDLTGCIINLVDISPLRNMKTINKLILSGCKSIVDIEPLKDIISINVLVLNSCISINNFSYLSNIKMNKLCLSQCNIKNSDLKYFKNLEYLDISYIDYPLDITLLNNNNILEINSRN
jgi:hypothetical protein